MARDEFPAPVKDALARRASFVCSNPDCRALTIAPADADAMKVLYIGKAAHIGAAAEGGPRYDAAMSVDDRKSIANAIFLCASCADMIDCNGGMDFPVLLLRTWKSEHEAWVRANLNRRTDSPVAVVARPFIHVEPGPIHDFDIGRRTGVSVKIKNIGLAPAYRVTSDVAVGILPYPFPADHPFPAISDTHDSVATLAPGVEHIGFGQFDNPLTEGLIQAVLDGTKLRLYVGGTITYRNSDGLRCTKRFLMSVGGPDFVAAIRLANGAGQSNLVWHYANRYNDLNPECE